MTTEIADHLNLYQNIVSTSTQYFFYKNAIFVAQHAFYLYPSLATAVSLASAYISDAKFAQAKTILQNYYMMDSDHAKYLYALCCFELQNFHLAEITLRSSNDAIPGDEYGLFLLGSIYDRTSRKEEAVLYYKMAIKKNPSLWVAYEALALLGAYDDNDYKDLEYTNQTLFDYLFPDQPSQPSAMDTNRKNLFHLDQTTPMCFNNKNNNIFKTPTTDIPISNVERNLFKSANNPDSTDRKPEIDNNHFMTPDTFSTPSPMASTQLSTPSAPSQYRKGSKPERYPSRLSFETTPKHEGRNPRKLCAEFSGTSSKYSASSVPLDFDPVSVSTDESMVSTFRKIALTLSYLTQCRFADAVTASSTLQPQIYGSGHVLSLLGRAYMELGDYAKAERYFEHALIAEPNKLEGLVEYYSTVLWHGRKATALASLAQRCVRLDQLSPATWCVVGNCFSLQKDQENALKSFLRAANLDNRFTYAHTLAGHEYSMREEFENALKCYRKALSIEPTHYNAWYGIATVYRAQEKYSNAEQHFRAALNINRNSSILHYHLGCCLISAPYSSYEDALKEFSIAIELDEENPVPKFERAKLYSVMGDLEASKRELITLNEMLPKEAAVYYELGLVMKKLGDRGTAIKYFTNAIDLDPKEKSYKRAVDMIDIDEDDML